MKRIAIEPRHDLEQRAAEYGFDFHRIDGATYWDESACYEFTLAQIERDLEDPTTELEALCRELVGRAVGDERMLARLRIPEHGWDLIAESWKRGDQTLYGRFDLAYDGRGPARLLEYNADTPTSLFEASVFQWVWLEDMIERRKLARRQRPVQLDPRGVDRAVEGVAWQPLGWPASAPVLHDGFGRGPRVHLVPDRLRRPGRLRMQRAVDRGDRRARQGAVPRSGQQCDQPAVQALSVGMAARRAVRPTAADAHDALHRAAVEADPVQQGDPAAAVGDGARPSRTCSPHTSTTTRAVPSWEPASRASRSIRAKAPTSCWSTATA